MDRIGGRLNEPAPSLASDGDLVEWSSDKRRPLRARLGMVTVVKRKRYQVLYSRLLRDVERFGGGNASQWSSAMLYLRCSRDI